MNIINRIFRIVLTIILTITLASCDSGNINKVKDSVFYDIDTSMTIGKAFGTRTDCEKGKWSEEKDTRGRSIVTYTCSLPERYLEHANDITFSSLDKKITSHNQLIEKRIKDYKKWKEEKNGRLELLINSKDKLESVINNYVSIINEVEGSDLKELQRGTNGLVSGALYLSSDEQAGGNITSLDSFCKYDIRNLVPSIYTIIEPTEEEKFRDICQKAYQLHAEYLELYKAAYLRTTDKDGVFKPLFIGSGEESINNQINKHLMPLNSNKSINYDNIFSNRIKNYNENIELLSQDIDKSINSLIDKEQVNKDKENVLKLENVKAYTKWMVTDSGGVELVSSEIASHYGNKTVTMTFNKPKEAVALAYADFREDRIPTMYINAMKNSVQKDYDAFVLSISNK